jgi:putative transposase
MKWSRSPHRPLHLYLDGAWYFVTVSAVDEAHVLASDEHFNVWMNILKELIVEFKIKLTAWVALANHYHLLFLPQRGDDLGVFMKRLNGRTSYALNSLDQTHGRSVWYSYWDTCIRGERDFWTRFNYIHYNPVKHGYVQQPEDWLFSSYRYYLRNEESMWLEKCFRDFPIHELSFDEDMLDKAD